MKSIFYLFILGFVVILGCKNSTDPKEEWTCYPDLPAPELIVVGTEDYEADGFDWTRYLMNVKNNNNYPNELFSSAPNLPPCGLNNNSSRTWVEIYARNDNYIYGFCALESSKDLNSIWFSVKKGTSPPDSIYITLNDRFCKNIYISNFTSTDIGSNKN